MHKSFCKQSIHLNLSSVWIIFQLNFFRQLLTVKYWDGTQEIFCPMNLWFMIYDLCFVSVKIIFFWTQSLRFCCLWKFTRGFPLDTGRKLNVLGTFNLRPVFTALFIPITSLPMHALKPSHNKHVLIAKTCSLTQGLKSSLTWYQAKNKWKKVRWTKLRYG